jgi:hypothetical protein
MNQMKNRCTLLAFLFLCFGFSTVAQVTRVDLNFTPVDGGNVVSANAINGINGFVVSGPINLSESTEYRLTVSLGNQDAALKARQNELQFFFVPSNEELLIGEVKYDDTDANNRPVGFTTLLTTECKEDQESGTLQITLNDFGNTKLDTSSIAAGLRLFDLTWALNVNNDPSAPACENEEEIITDVILTFTPTNGGDPVVARAQDPDGEGVLGLEILDDIVLGTNTTYEMAVQFKNEIEGEDITEEVREEDDEHLLLFAWTAGVFSDPAGNGNTDNRTDLVNYNDFDEDNLPVGLSTNWTVSSTVSTGTFRVVLKHQPGIKTTTSGINEGSTDVDLTWNIRTELVNSTQEQMRLNQELRLAPNPVKNNLNWTIRDQANALVNIRIFDQMGRLVLQSTTKEPSLNITRLNPGNYVFQVQTEQGVRVQRFVKVD